MATDETDPKAGMKIKVSENGPYIVCGSIPLEEQSLVSDADGLSSGYRLEKKHPLQSSYELCRCGQSDNKPFCDQSHMMVDFDGTETAGHTPFADQIEPPTSGPELVLNDALKLCASARFCDRNGGVWDRTRSSDDPESKQVAIEEVWNCPAGRLVLKDRQGQAIEPEFEPSIVLISDPFKGTIGPIWVRGGIPIESADGQVYEIRNRVTLCRCGQSRNKPFCDGTHVDL